MYRVYARYYAEVKTKEPELHLTTHLQQSVTLSGNRNRDGYYKYRDLIEEMVIQMLQAQRENKNKR